MPQLGGSNGFPMDRVRAQPSTGLLPGAAERKLDDHLLLEAAWDELGVDGSEGEGFGSAASHTGDSWKESETSLGGGGK